MLSVLHRAIDRIVDVLTWIACIFCFLMMIHVTADVAGRTLFAHPLSGTIEIVSAYYMVALAFLPLAWITRDRGHIIVELFTARLPTRALLLLDLVVRIFSLLYVALFTWQAAVMALEKTALGELWEAALGFVAVWPSRWLLAGGCAMMALYLVLQIATDVARLAPGGTGSWGRHDRDKGEAP